jgi:hypothetical protein
MSRIRILLLVICLIVILAFALLLWGGSETALAYWVFGGSGFAPALLFFIFFGALAGVAKLLVDIAFPRRMSLIEGQTWERIRRRGKTPFLVTSLVVSGVPIIVGLPVYGVLEGAAPEVIRNYVIVTVVLLAGIAAIGNAIWNYQESVYLKTNDSRTT